LILTAESMLGSDRDEATLLRRLDRLVESGAVTLSLDKRKFGSLDFPLAIEAEGNRWAYGTVLATVLGAWQGGLPGAALVMIAGIGGYLVVGRPGIEKRLNARVRDRGLKEIEIWRRLWRFGGVILTGQDGVAIQGPGDSWMNLVRLTDTEEPSDRRPSIAQAQLAIAPEIVLETEL